MNAEYRDGYHTKNPPETAPGTNGGIATRAIRNGYTDEAVSQIQKGILIN